MNHYFLGTQLLASGVGAHHSHSLAYFCPACGDIWARMVAEDSQSYFDIVTVYCERHVPAGVPGWGVIPGTLCMGSQLNLSTMCWIAAVEVLPDAVLEREFTVLYRYYHRNLT